MVWEDPDRWQGDKWKFPSLPCGVCQKCASIWFKPQIGCSLPSNQRFEQVPEIEIGAGNNSEKWQKAEIKVCIKVTDKRSDYFYNKFIWFIMIYMILKIL